MSGLFRAIREALIVLAEDCEGSEPLFAMHSALRAVVERHRPSPGGEWDVYCIACGAPTPHPCEELKRIAEKLGITEGVKITDEQP